MSGVDPADVGCSQCGAQPGRDCIGYGEGYHLSRFDRAEEATEPEQRVDPVKALAEALARDVLAAIARNEVPGVTLAANREPDGLRAAIEALAEEWRARARRLNPGLSQGHIDLCADDLDALLAAHPATDHETRREPGEGAR